MQCKRILMTGGTGFIGSWTATRLSHEGHEVYIIARNAKKRRESFQQWIASHGGLPENIHLLEGDLCKLNLGLSDDDLQMIQYCQIVYHMGAAYSWGLSASDSQKATVGGVREFVKIIRKLPMLERVIHLTGYMLAAPHIWNLLGMDALKRDASIGLTERQSKLLYRSMSNYEAAKIEAHFVMSQLAKQHALPLTNIELTTVAGHSETGEIHQPQGLPSLIKAIWDGNMPIIPSTQYDWMPIVSIDYLVSFITGILSLPNSIGESYIVLDDSTPNLAELIQQVAKYIGDNQPIVHLPKSWVHLALKLGGEKLTGVPAESMDLIKPYQYDTQKMKAVAKQLGLVMPNQTQVINRTVDYLTSHQFETHKITKSLGNYYRISNTQTFLQGNRELADTVFLHGLPFNGNAWNGLIDKVRKNTTIKRSPLIVDLPNVSRSKGVYTSKKDWMENLLSPVQAKVDLIAHSYGSSFALEFATHHPERVKSLTLIAPYFIQQRASWVVSIPLISQIIKRLSQKRFEKYFLTDIDDKHIIEATFSNTRRPNVIKHIINILRKTRRLRHRKYYAQLLTNIAVPTLLIDGNKDTILTEEKYKLRHNPLICIKTINGAGHNPHITHTTKVYNEVF